MANFFEDVRNIPYADVFCKIARPQMCGFYFWIRIYGTVAVGESRGFVKVNSS